RSPLLHLTHRDVHAQVARLNDYSALASRTAFEAGRRFSLVRTLTAPMAAFVKSYLVKAGMLDGVRGLIVAVNHAHYVFLKGPRRGAGARRPKENLGGGPQNTAGARGRGPLSPGKGSSRRRSPSSLARPPRQPAATPASGTPASSIGLRSERPKSRSIASR